MRAASEDPIGAFEVSKTRRKLQVTVAVIYCLLGAGIIFGYAGKTYPNPPNGMLICNGMLIYLI